MARSIKIKGKDAVLTDLIGKTFDKVEQVYEGGTYQVWFRGSEDFCLWGASCCCDVASIDTVFGDLNSVAGEIQKVSINNDLYMFANTNGDSATVKWYSKHPRFLEKGVKLTRKGKA